MLNMYSISLALQSKTSKPASSLVHPLPCSPVILYPYGAATLLIGSGVYGIFAYSDMVTSELAHITFLRASHLHREHFARLRREGH